MDNQFRVNVRVAEILISEIFKKKGCIKEEANLISKRLCLSNLKGHDRHGIVRVPRYCDWVDQGKVFPNKQHSLILDSGALALIDANQGFGQIMGEKSVQEGTNRAKNHGIALIGLKNSGHLGRIGDWSELAADKNCVSLHFVNVRGSLLVAPYGGSDRRGSTSPLSIGIPVKGKEHVILDMATSTVAEGKALVAQKGGKKLPMSALIDNLGNLTNNTEALYGKIGPNDVPNPDKGDGAITAFGSIRVQVLIL